MRRPASGFRHRLAPALICLLLAAGGCGGGEVSVRSNFTGPPIGTAPPAAPVRPPAGGSAPQGLFATGEGNILLAVILAMMIIDGLSWATERIGQALANSDPAAQPQTPPTQPVERKHTGPPAYSWVFNR